MILNKSSVKLASLLFLSLCLQSFAAEPEKRLVDELTPDQLKTLRSKGQYAMKTKVPGHWPMIDVYQVIEASAEESAALFFDFNNHTYLNPSLKKSAINKQIDAKTFLVDYTLSSPLGLENYTMKDILSSYEGGKSYKIEWEMQGRSKKPDGSPGLAKGSTGFVRFEDFDNGSLVRYNAWVDVDGLGALQGLAETTVKETAKKLAQKIKEKKNSPEGLKTQVEKLRDALKS